MTSNFLAKEILEREKKDTKNTQKKKINDAIKKNTKKNYNSSFRYINTIYS